MKRLTGRFLKTLSHSVDKDIRESLYQNDVFLGSQWGFLEKSIVLWSSRYKKYILLALFLSVLVVTNLILWQSSMRPYVLQYFPNWKRLLDWQGIFLGGQLTIIGVVYPLVVGLISVLFQNKSAKKIIFQIYQKYSGFMFAGLSGLALSCFILVGYFLRASIEDSTYAAICVTSGIWLSSNILLTAWFFVKTFLMLDEPSRDRLVLRFSIHSSCELDIREKIKNLIFLNSVDSGLLVNPDEMVLKVSSYKYSDGNDKVITCKVNKEKSLKNVKFWLINLAIHLQVRILKLRGLSGGTLVLESFRASRNSNEIVVAKYVGFTINPLVKILIQSSFSFEKSDLHSEYGLVGILNSFVGPANDALRDGDAKEFSNAVDNLSNWHTEVAQALSFKRVAGRELFE